jgi:hypothetical protein
MITYRESEEPITCPYCESEENCDHLFALYDETFDSIDGGYIYDRPEFDHLLSEFILAQLAKNDPKSLKIDFEYTPLRDLWEEIIEEERCVFDEETKQWELDLPNLNRLILDLLDDLIYPEYGEFEGGPGQSSAYRIYYAKDTQVAFNELLEKWKGILKVPSDSSK